VAYPNWSRDEGWFQCRASNNGPWFCAAKKISQGVKQNIHSLFLGTMPGRCSRSIGCNPWEVGFGRWSPSVGWFFCPTAIRKGCLVIEPLLLKMLGLAGMLCMNGITGGGC